MKKYTVIMLVAFFTIALCSAVSSAQQTQKATQQDNMAWQEYHQLLTTYHNNALEHTKALYWQAKTLPKDVKMNNETAKGHVEAIGQSLEKITARLPEIRKSFSEAEKKNVEMSAQGMQSHYEKAMEYYQPLQEEVAKDNSNKEKVMDLTAGIYQQLQKAEAAHVETGEKIGAVSYMPDFVQEMRTRQVKLPTKE